MRQSIGFLRRVLPLALAVVLAGCGSGGGSGGGGGIVPDGGGGGGDDGGGGGGGTPIARTKVWPIGGAESVRDVAPNGMFITHAPDGTPSFHRSFAATPQALKPLVEGQRLAADAVNAKGAIVGRALDLEPGLLYWSSPGARPVRVAQLSAGSAATITDLNLAGEMVGWEAAGPDQPLYWPRYDAEPVRLATRSGGAAGGQGRVHGITDGNIRYGTVGGGKSWLAYWFYWLDGTMYGPTNLTPFGDEATRVVYINSRNLAVGEADRASGAGPKQVAIYYPKFNEAPVQLPIDAADKASRALHVSGGGLIGGSVTGPDGKERAVVWPEGREPVYLQTLVGDYPGQLQRTLAIADDKVVFCLADGDPSDAKVVALRWPD